MNLEKYSLNELQTLQTSVEHEIKKRLAQVKKEGIEKIKTIAEEYGLSVDELKVLISTKGQSGRRGSVAPKYRDPNDFKNIWTGRGRRPKWVEAFLKSGGQLSQITI